MSTFFHWVRGCITFSLPFSHFQVLFGTLESLQEIANQNWYRLLTLTFFGTCLTYWVCFYMSCCVLCCDFFFFNSCIFLSFFLFFFKSMFITGLFNYSSFIYTVFTFVFILNLFFFSVFILEIVNFYFFKVLLLLLLNVCFVDLLSFSVFLPLYLPSVSSCLQR